ncbi:MAG: hypothetical protein RLZ22_117 [Verrucomicrobiota bacterium]|jgi:hypothetical protein
MTSQIDIARLEKVRRHGTKITARCPACAVEGGDKAGNHFFQNAESGKFGCAKHPGDKEHRREIFRLVGIRGERDPLADQEWRRQRAKVETQNHARRRVSTALRSKRDQIVAAYPWTSSEALAESPEKRMAWLQDPRLFIAALFPAEAIVWTGETYQSGQDGRHAARWKTVADWQAQPIANVGPMISPALWHKGETSRTGGSVASAPYTVLDFDGFDGVQPQTEEGVQQHLKASMALVRWLRERLDWQLAALVYTGNKSLHAWFHTPSPDVLESLKHSAKVLGVDAGLIGRPEHPCRLP